ncbi:unnamed protein product [Linum trigynum]|uniref:CCHC-type domain-containing protein n=1 Tax=Linum trigynum TaxID=586398 RepID=A0AAV2D8K9_9ROSI
MRRRYGPTQGEMHRALDVLRQGSNSVYDYYKKMKRLMARADFDEDEKETIARFLNGLNRGIRHVVEIQPFIDLNELVQMAIQVEKQQKRGYTRHIASSTNLSLSDTAKASYPRHEDPKPILKSNPSLISSRVMCNDKTRSDFRSSDVMCYKCQEKGHMASQCPKKRRMVPLENKNVQNVQSDNENKLVQRELIEADKRIKIEQEVVCARSVDIDSSHDSSRSIGGDEVVVEANVNDEKE